MRVRFRRYCYDCRRGSQWLCKRRGKHNWFWDYFIFCGNTRLKQKGGFLTYERALESAERTWKKLQDTSCICAKEHCERQGYKA